MKRIMAIIVALALSFNMTFICLSDGDGNMDGGGGDMGSGDGSNVWQVGNDGVRITVVRASGNSPAKLPVDFTHINSPMDVHFGKRSKLDYRNGSSLSPQMGTPYLYASPAQPLPSIVSSSGGSNIVAIKSYFTDRFVIENIAQETGIPYETLISGDYKLLIEPIAYFTYMGIKMAATAHEAALYDQMTNGDLRAKLGNLTHKNLPLAMFLEFDELGFPAWSGSASNFVSNVQIISSLGLGIVRFNELEGPPPEGSDLPDYEYHTNTDVISAVWVSTGGNEINPDDHARVTFSIPGVGNYSKTFVLPPYEEQLVWVKWRTPAAPTTINISVSSNRGSLSKSTLTCRITEFTENTPPNPVGTDRNNSWRLPSVKSWGNSTSASWGVWDAWWHENWEWDSDWEWVPGEELGEGYWEDNGSWVDNGWWDYDWIPHRATLYAKTMVSPDERVPTANKVGTVWWMKSAYGINVDIETRVTITGGNNQDVTPVQNVQAVFPEFGYETYNRLLEPTRRIDWDADWRLKANPFSQWQNPVHFSPIWYPDNTRYEVATQVLDVWTPVGQLYYSGSDYVMIDGNVYDDWHIRPDSFS